MKSVERMRRKPQPVQLAPLRVADLLAVQHPPNVVVGDDILDEAGLMLVVSPTSMGKSYLLLQLAMSLACGADWLGHRVPVPRRVYLAQAEIGAKRFQSRVGKLWGGFGAEREPGALWLESTYDLKLDSDDGLAALVEVVGRLRIEVVVVDPLRPFFAGDENSSKEVQALFDSFRELQIQHKTAIVFSHHDRKPAEGGGAKTMYDTRGTALITDRPDTVLRLKGTGQLNPYMVKVVWHKLRNRGVPLPDMTLVIGENGLFEPVQPMVAVGSAVAAILQRNGEMEQAELVGLCAVALKVSKRVARQMVEELIRDGGAICEKQLDGTKLIRVGGS